MPAGDAQRVWFDEMIAELTAWWEPDASWEDFVEFCH